MEVPRVSRESGVMRCWLLLSLAASGRCKTPVSLFNGAMMEPTAVCGLSIHP